VADRNVFPSQERYARTELMHEQPILVCTRPCDILSFKRGRVCVEVRSQSCLSVVPTPAPPLTRKFENRERQSCAGSVFKHSDKDATPQTGQTLHASPTLTNS
jgi:hypothetical protein